MRVSDAAEYAYSNLKARKLRSWLTILGIIIGVASIISLISLANGVNQQITSRLNLLGDNIIQITPGAMRATRIGGMGFPGLGGPQAGGPRLAGGGDFGRFETRAANQLTFNDAQEIARINGIAQVDARVQGRVTASLKGKNASVTIIGVDPPAFNAMSTTPLVSGRNLNPNDRYAAVVGNRVYTDTFAGEELLNRQFTVKNSNGTEYAFRVVGLLNASSGSFSTSDNAVYVPVNIAKAILGDANPSQIMVMTTKGRTADEMAPKVQQTLTALHHVPAEEPDFTITTASVIQSTVADIANTLALFLGGIAAISLIVGGIGVANTMFMSVLERTKEIGILKALGMKDSEVTELFIFEAIAIGTVGGIAGVALSFGVSYLLAAAGIPSVITLDLVLLGLLFSAGVGVASGLIPARNAASLEPVEALRYE